MRPTPLMASSGSNRRPPDWTEPTIDELRPMAYTAIANGATGLIACACEYGPYGTGICDYP